MKIRVEFLTTHTSTVHDVEVLPRVGEGIDIDDEYFEVKMVIHMMTSNDGVVAIVRVR